MRSELVYAVREACSTVRVYAFERQMKYDGEKMCVYENWLGNALMFIDRFETVFFLPLLCLYGVDCAMSFIAFNTARAHTHTLAALKHQPHCAEHIYLFHESITGNGCFQCWLLAI